MGGASWTVAPHRYFTHILRYYQRGGTGCHFSLMDSWTRSRGGIITPLFPLYSSNFIDIYRDRHPSTVPIATHAITVAQPISRLILLPMSANPDIDSMLNMAADIKAREDTWE